MRMANEGWWLFGERGLANADRPDLVIAATNDEIYKVNVLILNSWARQIRQWSLSSEITIYSFWNTEYWTYGRFRSFILRLSPAGPQRLRQGFLKGVRRAARWSWLGWLWRWIKTQTWNGFKRINTLLQLTLWNWTVCSQHTHQSSYLLPRDSLERILLARCTWMDWNRSIAQLATVGQNNIIIHWFWMMNLWKHMLGRINLESKSIDSKPVEKMKPSQWISLITTYSPYLWFY